MATSCLLGFLSIYNNFYSPYSTPQLVWCFDFVATTTCLTHWRYCTGCVCRNGSTLNSIHGIPSVERYGTTVSEPTPSGIEPARSSSSAVVVHAAAARPAIPSVNSRPSLVSCRSLHFWNTARRRAVCTVCLFLPATAKDILVSPVISYHFSLNYRTTFSWTFAKV